MAYTISFEDESGNTITTFDCDITLDFQHLHQNENSILLKYLDPYGDTTFNQLMLEDLLSDLRQLSMESKFIQRLIEFVETRKGEVHTYLKFYGE